MTEETLPVVRPEIEITDRGLVPHDMDSLWRYSGIVLKADLAPDSANTQEKIFLVIANGLEIGLKPLQAVQNSYIVNKKPSIYGDIPLALVEASGDMEDFDEYFEGDYPEENFKAVCLAKNRKRSKPTVREFSIKDAKEAGLWIRSNQNASKVSPWYRYPKRMLQLRARSWTLRDAFAHVLKGIQIYEEHVDATIEHTPNGPVATTTGTKVESKVHEMKDRIEAVKNGVHQPGFDVGSLSADTSENDNPPDTEWIYKYEVQRKYRDPEKIAALEYEAKRIGVEFTDKTPKYRIHKMILEKQIREETQFCHNCQREINVKEFVGHQCVDASTSQGDFKDKHYKNDPITDAEKEEAEAFDLAIDSLQVEANLDMSRFQSAQNRTGIINPVDLSQAQTLLNEIVAIKEEEKEPNDQKPF